MKELGREKERRGEIEEMQLRKRRGRRRNTGCKVY